MTTIDEIYAALNPLPAMLSEKGKVKPAVSFELEANAGICIQLRWQKFGTYRDFENEYEWCKGGTFDEALANAVKFISDLPSAEQAKLQDFMGKLGRLIDIGKSEGIPVDFVNPLIKTMKRLSENALTYKLEEA